MIAVLAATRWLASIAVALAGQRAVAESPPTAESSGLPAVVVEARRLPVDVQVRAFVGEVTRRLDRESPALWHKRVCPLVAGLTRAQGEYVLQRISTLAVIAGAPLGAEDCRADLFVIFSTDPSALLRAWRKRDSRLERAAVLSIESAIVVVDTTRVQGRKLGPIADYVAMIGLAELRVDGDYAALPTILNLFRDPPLGIAPDALSDWDKSLLTAVYGSDQKYTMYRAQVTQRMLTEVPGR
jgi:hypothetical protein